MSMCNTPVSIAYPNPDNVPFNSPNIPPIVIVQLTSPVIPNLRDMTDSLQWHAMLDMLYTYQDTLIPMYIIEYFETVYQRRLIVPNDCKHIEVDTQRKFMNIPATCYEDMSLMYSEESVCWYTFIQSVKQPDKVAVIRVYIRGFDGRIPPIEETCCGVGYNILPEWDIEFPGMHRYIQHYNKAMIHDPLPSEHSMGQISKFANTYSTTSNTVSKLYNATPLVTPGTLDPAPDQDIVNLQDKLMKEFMENYIGNTKRFKSE